ncbi:MAG: hypothetical protein JO353_00195, partial [Phycisphaerae bacterium]|nr:hypothetical protein [Phycisphaerae bacterium]
MYVGVLVLLSLTSRAQAVYIWIEGEHPTHAEVTRHPWWYDRVQKSQLSGGDFISHWDADKAGQAIYKFDAQQAGQYEFWVRANPIQTTLSYRLNGSDWTPIDTAHNLVDEVNIAEGNALDIRFLAWMKIGAVDLKKGSNTVQFS